MLRSCPQARAGRTPRFADRRSCWRDQLALPASPAGLGAERREDGSRGLLSTAAGLQVADRALTLQFCGAIVLIFFLELAVAVLAFLFQDWVRDRFREFFESNIRSYRDDIDLQNLIDSLQKAVSAAGLSRCGGSGGARRVSWGGRWDSWVAGLSRCGGMAGPMRGSGGRMGCSTARGGWGWARRGRVGCGRAGGGWGMARRGRGGGGLRAAGAGPGPGGGGGGHLPGQGRGLASLAFALPACTCSRAHPAWIGRQARPPWLPSPRVGPLLPCLGARAPRAPGHRHLPWRVTCRLRLFPPLPPRGLFPFLSEEAYPPGGCFRRWRGMSPSGNTSWALCNQSQVGAFAPSGVHPPHGWLYLEAGASVPTLGGPRAPRPTVLCQKTQLPQN